MAALSMTPPAAAPAFLASAGWGDGTIVPLAGDASFRRYFRVLGDGRSAVLMDAPPQHEDSRPFIAVAEHLHRLGFAAPRILARDLEQGLILLEDFGDARMAEVIAAEPTRETAIYTQAIDLLRDLHAHDGGPLPPYDLEVLQREAALFPEWYMPAVGLRAAEGWEEAWASALAQVADSRSATVLRDYHAENIMLLASGGLGLLDFQDALAGHPAYDLVSLLQDARREVSPELEAAMLQHYGPIDDAAYAILGAQRNTKILGIFTRLWKRDGKPRYLAFQPRMWAYLERDLAHPALAEVRAWFDANVPPATRAAFWLQQEGAKSADHGADFRALDAAGWAGLITRADADPIALATITFRIEEVKRGIEAAELGYDRQRALAIVAALQTLLISPKLEWRALVELLLAIGPAAPASVATEVARPTGLILALIWSFAA